MIRSALLLLAGYAAGSLPFGFWIARGFKAVDVRTLGSKNTGATNVWRTCGAKLGMLTLLLDLAKGAFPAALALHFAGPNVAVLVGAAAVIGHSFPVLLGFGGGKGVATGAGVLAAVAPLCFVVALGVFLLALAIGRFVSLASMLGAVTCFGVAVATGKSAAVIAFCGLVGGFVILRHRANIGRLLGGTEPRIRLGKSRA